MSVPRGDRRRLQDRSHTGPALAAALLVHCGLLAFLGLGATPPPLGLPAGSDEGTMAVALTPASSLAAAVPRADALDALNGQLASFEPEATPTTPADSSARLLQQMDAPTGQSPSTAKPAQGAAEPPPLRTESSNPWAHASVASPDPELGRRFWARIKPCWKGGEASTLRLVLDASGRLQSLTAIGGTGALERARPAAAAVNGCAPYSGLVARAGTYTIVVPS